jgi:hypothetical protein
MSGTHPVPSRWIRSLAAIALALPLSGELSSAQERNGVPAPPASRPREYNPDPGTCKPALMEAAYRQRLAAFQDQSPQVLAQLQRLQRDLTVSSINRCISQGLMSREEAQALAQSLGLER